MSYVSFIARRYLKLQRGRGKKGFLPFLTVIAIAGITLGVMALLITLTILGGFEKEIKSKVAGFTTHVQVTGFQSQPLEDYEQARLKILHNVSGIATISPFVSKEGMASFKKNVEGILVKGIDPATNNTTVSNYIVQGFFDVQFQQGGFSSCVVGKRLLQKLQARLGDTVAVFGLVGNFENIQPPKIMSFVIRGVYESGMSEYDDVYFLVNIHAAQQLFKLGDVATGFDVMLNNVSDASRVAEHIQDTMGYPYYARTLFQLYRNLFTWIELQKKPVPVILGLIIIVATVNIIGTLLMVVMEKTSQIGILKSMGAKNSDIKRIFLYEGIFFGIIGTALGNLFAYAVCWLQLEYHFFSLPSAIYFMTTVPILFRWENFALVSGVALLLCFLASYVPSTLAAKLDPIRSIRFT
ncbi:MAG: ABC transporter permease [Bacteroidota bacterium]|nr:ABC transporter permease [Bacteroidota bacterium]